MQPPRPLSVHHTAYDLPRQSLARESPIMPNEIRVSLPDGHVWMAMAMQESKPGIWREESTPRGVRDHSPPSSIGCAHNVKEPCRHRHPSAFHRWSGKLCLAWKHAFRTPTVYTEIRGCFRLCASWPQVVNRVMSSKHHAPSGAG